MHIALVSVKALPDYRLRVCFTTGEEKVIDFSPNLKLPPWEELRNPALFGAAKAVPGGVIWNDAIDIAAEALYRDGIAYEEPA